MEGYHIDRFGSVDGIVLRSRGPSARTERGPDAGARELEGRGHLGKVVITHG
jgi:hypothetical protein